MNNFFLKQILNNCACWLMLGMLFLFPGQAYSASVSRSFLFRAIAPIKSFTSAHPRLAKTTGIGAAVVGAYACYWYLKNTWKNNSSNTSGAIITVKEQKKPQEQDDLQVMLDPNPMVDPAKEWKVIAQEIFDYSPLPTELINIILGYHFVPFRGVPVSYLADGQFQNDVCGERYLFPLSKTTILQVYGNYSDQYSPRVIVKLWNLENGKCEKCKRLAKGLVSFAFLDEKAKKLFIATSQNKIYELDLSSFDKKESSKNLSIFKRRLYLPIKIVLCDGTSAETDKNNNITIKDSNGKKKMQFACFPTKWGDRLITQLVELPNKQLLVNICPDFLSKERLFIVWNIASNPPICVKKIETSAIEYEMSALKDGSLVTQDEYGRLEILR